MARKPSPRRKRTRKPSLGAELLLYVQQRTTILNNPCAEISTLKKKLKALLHLEKAVFAKRRT